eukprot:TRINITY_DN7785_c0_g1_i1.p1 TRINITY_DN7785_c0_g1~~TRINITY_DN7785_c0_g1_i1.p1  ORF type:complete len:392 (+),score=88.97 TRINITY_DN7785_c0_g1_i1:60-1178(+)
MAYYDYSQTWFSKLFGFIEETGTLANYKNTKDRFAIEEGPHGVTLLLKDPSKVSRKFRCGRFETPTLGDLRNRALAALKAQPELAGTLTYNHEKTFDVMADTALPERKNAVFQVASQFNCLEFPSSHVTPEAGVTPYVYDNTQGPACAVAAAPATVYRNYFARVGDQEGQTAEHQINNLDQLEQRVKAPYWKVSNGYTFPGDMEAFRKLSEALPSTGPTRDELRDAIKIGVQFDVEVTNATRDEPLPPEKTSEVTQVFCSAVSCSYSGLGATEWEPLALLVLEAAYEATLWAGVLNHAAHRSPSSRQVYLTKVGGGVFGNKTEWIASAIGRACTVLQKHNAALDVILYHFRAVNEAEREMYEAAYRKEQASL